MNATFVKLGSVAEYINGVAFKPEDWGDSGTKIIRIQNLTDPSKPFNRTERTVSDKYRVRPGDLLVSWSATLGVFEWIGPDEALLNQHIFRVLPDENKVEKRYLRYALEGALLDMQQHLHGATMQHVNRGAFLDTKLFLPSLPDQKRIADILDRAEALRAKRRATLDQLDELTQSIFYDMFGDSVSNPIGWKRCPLKHCVDHIQIGPFGSLLHKEDYIFGGIPLINPMHIQDGKIVPDLNQSVTVQKHAELQLYQLRQGDVIMGRRGEMGRCAIVGPEHNGMLCGTGSLFIRPDESKAIAIYLQATLSSAAMRKYLEVFSLGATLPNLNRGIVGELTISLPPIELQKKFAHRMESVDKLKSTYKASLAEIGEFFSSLQYRAFRGEI